MDQTYMKQKPVLPLVVSMALPMTLSMLVNSLYNIVDSIFIAKISDNAMTALSLVLSNSKLDYGNHRWLCNWNKCCYFHPPWCWK